MQLCYHKFRPEAVAPSKKSPYSAGWDLFSCQTVELQPGARFKFLIGLAIWWEPNAVQISMMQQGGLSWYGFLADRSGMADNHGITLLGRIVDLDYRKEVGVVVLNTGKEMVPFSHGTPICQIIPKTIFDVREAYERDVIDSTIDRGPGFGSRVPPIGPR